MRTAYRRNTRRDMPVVLTIAIDVLCGALIMLLFYITNYVITPTVEGSALPAAGSVRSETASPEVSATTPTPSLSETANTPSAPPLPTDDGTWRAKFPDKFTSGAVERTENSYKSANINVSIQKVTENGTVYFLADIYVAELKYFKSAFAKSPGDKLGYREFTDVIAKDHEAVLAINGDHLIDNKDFAVRNSVMFDLPKSPADKLVLYDDGRMETFTADQLDKEKIKEEGGVYQLWTFGPMLLKDGQPMTKFNTTLSNGGDPRTAVGYYEPGHYCFLVVDGRQPGYSDGLGFEQMSQLFYQLGCKAAFNLDGGRSTQMVFSDGEAYETVNQPYAGGRSTSEILYITDK